MGKVLFIDDQEDFLKLIEIRLKDEEYKKFFCTEIDTALGIIRDEDIDVVVSDMNMPISGLEFFEILKKEYPQVVRITLSGLYQSKNILDAINKGEVYRYILKPWKVDEEGKGIIRDAVKYAEFTKFKYYCDCNTEVVSMEKLKEVLEDLRIDHELVEGRDVEDRDIRLNLRYGLRIKG